MYSGLVRFFKRSISKSGRSRRPELPPRLLRCEPLEDRRMLSITLFVNDDAAPGGDGLAWETAYDDLQTALTQAATLNSDGDAENNVEQIWIAEGTYKPSAELESGDPRSASFSLLNGVTLYGGFSGTETALDQRDWSTYVTTLSGDFGALDEYSDNAYSVVYCGANVEAAMDGLSIIGGYANGSYISNHPERHYGAGIYTTGTLTVTNSTLADNAASVYGGGIASAGTLTLTSSTISGNVSYSYGGGIYNWGTLTVTNSMFSENTAFDGGGGIYSNGALIVTNSTLSDNITYSGPGGGIGSTDMLTVTNSMLSGNSASTGGGISNSGVLNVTNSMLLGNSASYAGGGIYSSDTLTVTNSTLSDNSASYIGGGIYIVNSSSVATLNNTIVAKNSAPSGPDIWHSSGTLSGSHNLIGDGMGQSSLVGGVDGNQVGTSSSPIDPLMSDAGHLLPGSPAINAGSNALAFDPEGNPLTTDLDDKERFIYGTVDIGAYEYLLGGDVNKDGFVGGDDLDVIRSNWGSDTATMDMGDFNRDGFIGGDDLDIVRANWGTALDLPVESVLRVDADAAPGGNGLTWGTAYDNLQAALTQAATFNSDGNSSNDIEAIWIAEGIYKPSAELEAGDPRSASFSLVGGVTLYGGFSGTEATLDQRDWSTCVTTLSGNFGIIDDNSDNAYTVVYCGANVEAAVDGISIIDGKADGSTSSSHPERRFGAGIYSAGTLTVTNSTLSDNSADRDGSGIYSNGILTLTNSTLSNNVATGRYCYGGGISNAGIMTVMNSTLWNNSAYHGSGISNSGTLTVTNSTFSLNSAFDGGGIYSNGITTIANSTLSVNSARNGGGIYIINSSSVTKLDNTVVARNSASSGPDIYRYSGTLSGSHNMIGDGTGQSSLEDGIDGNQVGTNSSPIDPRLSDWTQYENGLWGYSLSPDSPAIDAGNNTLAVDAAGQPLTEDICGNARIQNGTVDIGAAEGATASIPSRTYLVTSLENTIADDGALTFLEAFEAANRNQPVGDAPAGSFNVQDVIQFAEGLSGTILVDDGELTILGDLNIEGSGAEFITFDARGNNRVFSIPATVSAHLSGMTITGGSADEGGGIHNKGTLTVMNAVLLGNTASYGGGVHNSSGTLSVVQSTLSGNSANQGGGIYTSGTLTVTNSTLSGNNESGIFNTDSGKLTITNTTISGNSTINKGGGISSNGITELSQISG